MVCCCKALRKKCRGAPGRLGKTHRSESCRPAISDWKVRYGHVDAQRNLNWCDESAGGNLLCSREVSRCRAHRRYSLVFLRCENRHGRARDRRDAHWRAKSAGVAAGLCVVRRFGESVRTRRKDSEPWILFRFPGVQKGASAVDDAEYAQHRTHTCAAIQA